MTRFRRAFERVLETILLALMTLLAVVVISGVLCRKLGAPLVWYDEVASVLLAWVTYYGACLAALHRAHIGFPALVESVSSTLRGALILAREVVVVGFFALAAWTGWQVVTVLDGFYLSSVPWMPRQLTQSVIPISSLLFIVAELLSTADVMAASTRPAAEESLP